MSIEPVWCRVDNRGWWRREWFWLVLLTGAGLLLRLWALETKGLSYDEAATALMARATPSAIVYFHWDAAFEHPPGWQLIMHVWSAWFGQSEMMLRLLPVLAGAAAIPALWWWLRLMWPAQARLRLLTCGLTAISPVLVLYSQEARMYTLFVLLALCSLIVMTRLLQPRWYWAALYIVINWATLSIHYYGLLLIGTQVLFLLTTAVWLRPPWRHALWWGASVLGSVIPIALWMLLAPGFGATLAIVGGFPRTFGLGTFGTGFDVLWRNLMFGAFRWQPSTTQTGYLLLPLALLGGGSLAWQTGKMRSAAPFGWLIILVVTVPLFAGILFSGSLAARYILFVTPAIYVLVAAGILWLWQRHRMLGVAGLVLACIVSLLGLSYYFGDYRKSDYREMAAFLREHRGPDDGVLLYAPRQHLLAKYYLPAEWPYYTAPHMDLPDFWPATAPRVIPEELDDQIQSYLRTHPALWLVATAENEVDAGEFVPKYLTAVAYKEECWTWLDVYLCRFVSPDWDAGGMVSTPAASFGGELRLERAVVRRVDELSLQRRYLLVQLDWLAEQKPTVDFRVTLRLLDESGNVVVQRDEFPIGTLLPPTTWNAGDAKPGYMVLPLPETLPAGEYTVTVGVYNPVTGAQVGDFVALDRFTLKE